MKVENENKKIKTVIEEQCKKTLRDVSLKKCLRHH